MPANASDIRRSAHPQERYGPLLHQLRQHILQGRWPAGHRLPTRQQLAQLHDTTLSTVQKALDVLMEDGLVLSRGCQGTLVVEHPPHLCEVALVVPHASRSDNALESNYWAALSRAAEQVSQPHQRLRMIFGEATMQESAERLRFEYLQKHRLLSGVIYATNPFTTELRDGVDQHIPRVIMGYDPIPGEHLISLDHDAFYREAVAFLAGRGCRRIGLFLLPLHAQETRYQTMFERELNQHGLTVKPHWVQRVGLPVDYVQQVATMLAHLPKQHRPDGLIIGDDNLETHVLAGLHDAKLKLGHDLTIVSHANFPTPACERPGVHRLGFDLRHALRLGLTQLRNASAASPTTPRAASRRLVGVRWASQLTVDFTSSWSSATV